MCSQSAVRAFMVFFGFCIAGAYEGLRSVDTLGFLTGIFLLNVQTPGGGGREWQWCRASYVTGASN